MSVAAAIVERAASSAASGVPVALVVAALTAVVLTRLRWRGSPTLIPIAVALPLAAAVSVGVWVLLGLVVGAALREHWRLEDIRKGQDKARQARQAVGVVALVRNRLVRRRVERGEFTGVGHPIGFDESGSVVCLPSGTDEGRHVLAIGATGAGKTTTLLAAAGAHVGSGGGLLVVDPKGDAGMAARLQQLASRHGRAFKQFSLTEASARWNPLAHGTPTERADKVIAAEEWTEPHYKRLYQRYLLTTFLAFAACGKTPDFEGVAELLDPRRLALFAREIPGGPQADKVDAYLDQLTDRDRQDLAGLRNRVALLTDSEIGALLSANGATDTIDLLRDLDHRSIVHFSLNAARYPETVALLTAALIQDLTHVAGIFETRASRPAAAVILDEFSAFGSDHTLRLFQRARSAGLSLLLATQELADLRRIAPGFEAQILGNIEALVAHRQNVPDSAELVAQLAGTQATWIQTFQTDHATTARPTRGSAHRGHEFVISPDTVKQLGVGRAVVITKNPHAVRITTVTPPKGAA